MSAGLKPSAAADALYVRQVLTASAVETKWTMAMARIATRLETHDDLLALVSRAAAAGPMILDETFATQLVRDCHAALAKAGAA